MPAAGWRPPLLVLGALAVGASCAAAGLTASGGGVSLTTTSVDGRFLSNDVAGAVKAARAASARVEPAAPAVREALSPQAKCRPEMALIESTCVDRYEAHLLEAQPDGSLVPHPHYQRPEKRRYVAASRAGTKPQAYISQLEARDACANAGKRLCTLREWRRACTGPARATYPYGNDYEKGRCNVGKKHLLSLLHGADAAGWTYDDFNDPALDKMEGFLALTGEYTGCTSSEGVADLVGNLHEWVADRVDSTLPHKLPLPAIIQRRIGRHAGNGIFMGGFFSTLNQHGEGCDFTTAAHHPGYHDYSTGFRCCADADP